MEKWSRIVENGKANGKTTRKATRRQEETTRERKVKI